MPPAFLARERGRTCDEPADRVCPHRALQGSPRARIGRRAKKRPSGIDLRRGLCLPGSSAASRPASLRTPLNRPQVIVRVAFRYVGPIRDVALDPYLIQRVKSRMREPCSQSKKSSSTLPWCEGANQRRPCADRVKSGNTGTVFQLRRPFRPDLWKSTEDSCRILNLLGGITDNIPLASMET